VKENIPEVRKAGGSTLKTKRVVSRTGSSSTAPKITVFRDEEMAPPVPPSVGTGIGMKTPARKVGPDTGGCGVTPFRDELATPAPMPNVVAFTPFRDEVWSNTFIIRTYFTDYNLVFHIAHDTHVSAFTICWLYKPCTR
jgi:spindle assembly checkpoint component MAD3